MIIGKYTATRPNTDVPFYWVNPDPKLVSIIQFATNILVSQFGLPNPVYQELDDLNATHTWQWPNIETFFETSSYINANGGPDQALIRNNWFDSVGHTLLFVATEVTEDGDSEIQRIQLVG